jgi:hypothetical protein
MFFVDSAASIAALMPLYRLVSVSSLETASGGNQTVTLRLASCRRVAAKRAAREAGVVELDISSIQ